jgi:hypothetical protein
MAPHPSITAGVHQLIQTRGLRDLMYVAGLVVSQGRVLELAYGGLCAALHRPSRVYPPDDGPAVAAILGRIEEFDTAGVLGRRQLEHLYGGRFAVASLPPGFALARREAVLVRDGCLILGEYGEGARLARVTPLGCTIEEYYCRLPGVRHIHALQEYGDAGGFLVSTGDRCKVLDLWVAEGDGIRFHRRLQSRLAGYTAAVEVNGRCYFGSDFSRRPNFTTTLGGRKYFFPAKAYPMHVAAFHPVADRYIVAVNRELDISGGRRTLSIFDTHRRRFVYCDYMT